MPRGQATEVSGRPQWWEGLPQEDTGWVVCTCAYIPLARNKALLAGLNHTSFDSHPCQFLHHKTGWRFLTIILRWGLWMQKYSSQTGASPIWDTQFIGCMFLSLTSTHQACLNGNRRVCMAHEKIKCACDRLLAY